MRSSLRREVRRPLHRPSLLIVFSALAVAATSAQANIDVGSNGYDGAFNPATNVTVDLGLATTGAWDSTARPAGNGVYDPQKWAVVFHYTSVNIPAGVTVTFKNHPKNAPVVWLVQGAVTVTGTVSLDGQSGTNPQNGASSPGPGGGRGGYPRSSPAALGSGGFGWGGGPRPTPGQGSPGSYGTAGTGATAAGKTYGFAQVLPLIGGSGGSALNNSTSNLGPGAGGGALLIASNSTISVVGTIRANGGDSLIASPSQTGAGSGGAVRLIADSINGAGSVRARGGSFATSIPGGAGRIRVEANAVSLTDAGDPPFTSDLPGAIAKIWPDSTQPFAEIVEIGGTAAPSDPGGSLDFPAQDLSIANPNAVTVRVHTKNVPTDGSWRVEVRVVPKVGQDAILAMTFQSGNLADAFWTVSTTFGDGHTAVYARAAKN